MNHLRPRWRKLLRDLARSKSGTALVVLSLAVGVDTVSLFINAESMLRTAYDRACAAVKPSTSNPDYPKRV
jgi:hypothetical protein